jgi:hypothetical protein
MPTKPYDFPYTQAFILKRFGLRTWSWPVSFVDHQNDCVKLGPLKPLGEQLSYISSNVAGVLDRINRSYFLPAIQRPFVWQPDQIVALFDSLLKGYPISSFLLWEIKPERRTDWEIYKFIENFRFGDTHNELAEPDGRDVVLVLDGQQRLTPFLLACAAVSLYAPNMRGETTPTLGADNVCT